MVPELFRMSGKVGKKRYPFAKERILRESWRNRTCNRMGKMRNDKKNPKTNQKKPQEFESGSGRVKAFLELKLVKDVKGKKKPATST